MLVRVIAVLNRNVVNSYWRFDKLRTVQKLFLRVIRF